MPRIPVSVGLLPLLALAAFGQPTALTVDPRSREEVRQFYRAIYSASENVPMGWTGNYAAGNAGDTSAAFKEATRLRINFFRALVGVPAGITFNPTYNTATQDAALMQSVNAAEGNVVTLNHTPPTSWRFYTAAGADASAKSNLYYGKSGPAAVTGYIADAGSINSAIGHRRWTFMPQTRQMGTGDVPGDGTATRAAANATWILDGTPGGTSTSPRPTTRSPYVAYPPAGYVPHQLVFPRWSFSYPQGDFAATTVSMTRAGQSIPVRVEPLSNATIIGENTIVWVYDNTNSDLEEFHPRPAADTAYTVTLTNVRIGGVSQNFTYTVTVFDPDVVSPDFVATPITGPAALALNQTNTLNIARPAFTSGFDWRSLQFSPFAKTYTAETGLDGLIAQTTGNYTVVSNFTGAGSTNSYRLGHTSPVATQSLRLPDTYLVGSSDAAIVFSSRLGIAVASEIARVQLSTDDGESWFDIYTQAGTSQSATTTPVATENFFVGRRISLAAYAGRTIQVRFAFTGDPTLGSYLPGDNPVGWFIDNVTLTDVRTVTMSAFTRVASGSTIALQPTVGGTVALQARGVMFGAYPIEWGSVFTTTALDANANNNPGRLVNMSIRTNAGTGDNTLIVGVGLGGAGTSGDKAVLLRAVGPTLGVFGVGGALPDSVMTVFQGSTQIAQNDDWAGSFDFASVGAFAFATPARDAAIYNNAAPSGSYSIQITGKNNATGVALAEVYDATPSASFTATTPRLVNVAARTQVGTGDNILIAGFVVGGSTPVRVLVRAVGPTLGVFGVSGVLADPRLSVISEGRIVAENDNWLAADAATFPTVGAFNLTAGSRDAALVVTLQPGSYTAQVSGVNSTTGVALVEVYEVP